MLLYVVVEVMKRNEGFYFGHNNRAAEGFLHKRHNRYRVHAGNTQIAAELRIGSYLRRVEIQRIHHERIRLGYNLLFSHNQLSVFNE